MTNDKTGKNFIGVSMMILISKALGFVRDIWFARNIGTTLLADIYTQVFGLASLLFTSVGMAISSANIPNLTHYLTNENKEERNKYVSGLLTQISLTATVVSLLGIIFAPKIAKVILPGLDEEASIIAVTLTRIMLPTLLFISLAYITAGILQVHKHFLISSLISIPFNMVIIAALLIWKNDIFILGYVTTLGWLLQFIVQIPILKKEKYIFNLKFNFSNKHIRSTYIKLIPILIGNAALQVCLITDRAFASRHLENGSVAALSFGSTLFTTITSIFIVAMSTVTFPDLSRYSIEKDFINVRKILKYIFKVLFFILVPYLIIVSMYNREIIQLVYERGTFTEKSTTMTSTAFLFYSFCIAGYVCQEIFNRVYYSMKKVLIPSVLSLGCIALNYFLVMVFADIYGIGGIAGSTAAAFLVYAVIMSISVRKEVGAFLGKEFSSYLLRLSVCLVGMIGVSVGVGFIGLKGLIGSFLLPVALGAAAYLMIAYFTGVLKETLWRKG
ncbi:MAG: murein biosynthesis integral membrane protein MurJ [Clostridia bacterium]|nr:murein biosynthesis integral membrane protein MurJ [Clostridia bacterium]